MAISYYGPLFRGFKLGPAFDRALADTRVYGIKLIKSNTPVKTGNLRDNWYSQIEGKGIRWYNEAPYAIFVEYGTRRMAARRMLARSLPSIQAHFKDALARELGTSLGAGLFQAKAKPTSLANLVGDPGKGDRLAEVGRAIAVNTAKYGGRN